jgi:hypothetical protein
MSPPCHDYVNAMMRAKITLWVSMLGIISWSCRWSTFLP